MKTTLAVLKRKLVKSVVGVGPELSANNPYWLNEQRIKVYKRNLEELVREGEEFPNRRYTVTTAQKKSLENWIANMESKFLH